MKAVAIPYLIALVLGVIVLVVIAYWFLTTFGSGGEIVNESFCKGKLLQFCSDLTTGKIPAATDFYSEYAKECSIYRGQPTWPPASPDAEECDKILGI